MNEIDALRAKLEVQRELSREAMNAVSVAAERWQRVQYELTSERDRLRAELEAIRTAKPVRTEWMDEHGTWQQVFTDFGLQAVTCSGYPTRRLYAGPVAAAGPAEPLTEEQIERAFHADAADSISGAWFAFLGGARAAERAHGITGPASTGGA